MRAIRFHALGGPDVLRVEDAPEPTPKPGQVLLAVRAVGLNYADTMFTKGQYFIRPTFPATPGMEAAGEVLAVGEGVTDIHVGDRVMALGDGAYAERMVAPAYSVYPIPANLSFEQAAALPVQGLTAHHALTLAGRLAPGEKVLVHAAAGGVGTLAVQIARRLGASFVAGTVGSPAKADLVRSLGADLVVNYREDDFATRIRSAVKEGVDVVLEMLGGTEVYKRSLACLAPMGRMVVYGAATADVRGTVEPVGLMHKNLTITGYYMTPLIKRRELCAPPLAELAAAAAEGALRVIVGKTYPLEDAAEAHRDLAGRASTGKLVLVV
ncbi:quinone oxidoreductase family protein [Polyangium jinanense]|uniref:Zinc-binding dehydrogenase n=1 Tax=Polyangium jinanense TaxID=2829994 RepID=A0A9X3X9G0_9BACT|nr:zinc-binding dehydrogenase [Polyangium jinanense]MDC3957191.1 zinc-binding dehydrogenase [Polyangium jinanense]MDC3986652.1 zinc-binding dehydrogenase [Polyangium jinanense]